MAAGIYSHDSVIVVVDAVPITGFFLGADTIMCEIDGPRFGNQSGNDGDTVAWRAGNRMGTITLKLQQTSPSNLFLSNLLIAAEQGVFVTHDVFINDTLNLTQLVVGESAVIEGPAAQNFSDEPSVREWIFKVGRLTMAM